MQKAKAAAGAEAEDKQSNRKSKRQHKAWAEEMAHTMSPEKHKSNKVGKVIATVGEAFSYAVGAVFLPKNNKKEA